MTIETEDVVAQLRTRIEEHRAHLAQMEAKYGGPLVHHESGVGIVVNFGDLIELVARDQSLSERIAVLEMSLARCQECNRRHMRAKYRSPKSRASRYQGGK